MRDKWKKETSPEDRLLSMIFNKGPLDRVQKWALRHLPESEDELQRLPEWHPFLRLFCWSDTINEWWVTRRRVTRRPYHKLYKKVAQESVEP